MRQSKFSPELAERLRGRRDVAVDTAGIRIHTICTIETLSQTLAQRHDGAFSMRKLARGRCKRGLTQQLKDEHFPRY